MNTGLLRMGRTWTGVGGVQQWAVKMVLPALLLLLLPVAQALPSFNATSTETSIIVSWTADPTSTLQSFEIDLDGELKFTGDSTNLQTASDYRILLLKPGRQYLLSVTGVNVNNGQIDLLTRTQVTSPLRPILNAIGQSDVTTTTIRLTWYPNPQSQQSNYRIEHQDLSENGPRMTKLLTTDNTEYQLADLKPGHNYSIILYSVSDTQFSQPITLFENTVPLRPNITSLVTLSMSQVYIQWVAASGSMQSSFRVTYEKLGTGSPAQVDNCNIGSCTIQTDSSVAAGQAINIKVYAVQGNRESTAALIIGNTKPGPVRNLLINTERRQATSLMVLWEEPATYTSFRVTVDPDEGQGSSPSKDRANWTYTRNGLLSGKQYTFAVYTLSGDAESDPMRVFSYTRPPQPPAPMRADSNTVDTLDVKFSAPQSSGNFDFYRVSVSQPGGIPRSVDVPKSSTRVATFGSLRPGAKYTVSLVTVVGDNIESQPSLAELYVKPLPPRNLTLVAQAKDQLTVRWAEPPTDVPNSFSSFVVSIKNIPGSSKNLSKGSTLEATFSNLNPGTKYIIQVSTVSGNVFSIPTTRDYYTRPNIPRSLRQVSVTNHAITVEWAAPVAVGNEAGYNGYRLYISTSGLGGGQQVETIDLGQLETTHTFNGLFPGTQYLIELVSYLTDYSSTPPEAVSDRTSITVLTRPDPPRFLELINKTTTWVSVRWENPIMGSIDAYLVRIAPRIPGEYSPEAELYNNPNAYTYNGLLPGRTYDLHVYTKMGAQQSLPATVSFTMNPTPVENLAVLYRGTTSVEINWDEPYNALFDEFRITVKNRYDHLLEVTEVNGQSRKYTIGRLLAGEQYTVSIITLSNREGSSEAKLKFGTSPEGVATIEPVDIKTDAIEIRWSAPNRTEFSGYDLSITPNDGGIDLPIRVNRNEDLRHRFTLLRPGVVYNISIRVVTIHGSVSTPFFREIGTMPSSVRGAKSEALSTNAIRVSWDVDPNSVQTKFVVSYGVRGGSYITVDVLYEGPFTYNKDLIGLLPGAQYDIAISAFSSAQSNPITLKQATEPKPIQDLQVTPTSPQSIRVTWATAADSQQGSFFVRYIGKHLPSQVVWKSVDVSIQEAILIDLFPGEQYTVEVKARSAGVDSQVVSKNQNTFPLPPDSLAVDMASLTSVTARILWTHDPDMSYVTGWMVTYGIQGLGSPREEFVSSSVLDMTLNRLSAGQKYMVEVYGVTDMDLASQRPTQIRVTTKPLLTTVITKDGNATTTDMLVLHYTENAGEFDHYVFGLEPADAEPMQKERGSLPRQVVFHGLVAGFTYTVSVLTVSGDVSSNRQTHEFNTRPASPVVVTSQDVSSITVIITKPMGIVNQYVVQCKVEEDGATFPCRQPSRTTQADSPTVHLEYAQLKPHTRYQFDVRSQVNNDFSVPVTRYAKTGQAAPGVVGDFIAESLSPFKVRLTWSEPLEKNGEIREYQISYTGSKPGRQSVTGSTLVEAPSLFTILDDLKGGYIFTFTIRAVTVEPGTPVDVQIETPIGKPTLDSTLSLTQMQARKLNDTVQYDQFAVQLVDPFSDKTGEVVSYTIVVTTDKDDRMVNATDLLYWSDNVGHGRSGTYQVMKNCADLFNPTSTCGKSVTVTAARRRKRQATTGSPRMTTFVVGAEICNLNVQEYCNGRLSPSTDYFVKLRGFNKNGEFTDAPLSEAISTATAPPDGSVTVLVAVIVVLAILFLILALAIVFVLYRRRIICKKDEIDGMDSNSSRAWGGSNLRMSLRDSLRGLKNKTGDTSRPIRIVDFIEHVRQMSADSDFGFSEEYEDLKPVGRDQPNNSSELACNRSKNRFTNILPYDHSRVKLLPTDDEEGTDYINANYMPGFNSKREFIVTQGPLPSTRDDFWRMVWEQNCRTIVMLTKCVEKGREKCDHYWPIDSEPMFYGDLQVLILNETKCPEWIVTEFRISKGEQSRNIKHFHYIAWPDFGVPQQPQSLIRFVRLVRTKMPADGGPIIAHCSAGVGRSGAYIAVDHLLMEMQHIHNIDVFGVVYTMRQHRSQMVQTEQQYICIHHCLKCVIEGKENEMDPYSGEDNEAFDESPTHNIYNTIQSTQPNDVDEGITMESN